MKLPKSKLGFLLVAVYVFITIVIYRFEFQCSLDLFYCMRIGIATTLPFSLLVSLLEMFTDIFKYFSIFQVYFFSVFVNSILFYFIGSFIQNKFSQKTVKIITVLALSVAVIIIIVLGIRYFNKSDIWKPDNIVNINNPVNSGNYCQQDSDCVLMPQYQGCCPNVCEVEAVNVETKKRDKEARNKICGIKDYSRCKMPECAVPKQAVCEQNRCVVKEKQPANVNIDENIIISLDKAYYQKGETVNITIQNNGTDEVVIPNIVVEKYSVNQDESGLNKWEIIDRDIECPCNAKCNKMSIVIPTGSAKIFSWQQDTDKLQAGIGGQNGLICAKADLGKYRVKIDYTYGKMKEIQIIKTIYSNEFEIGLLIQSMLKNYKIISSYTSPGESSFVKVLGNTVFLTDISEGLLAIDVSNPEKPVLLDKIKIAGGGAYALATSNRSPYGSFIVVGGYGNTKVAFVDINNSKSLQIINEIDAKRTIQDIVMEGDYIYLAIDGSEIEIIRVEGASNHIYDDATRINKQGIIKVEGGGHVFTLAEYWDSVLNRPYLLVGQGESGISYYDLMKPAAPKLITHISNIGYVNIAALKDNFAYVSADGNLKIIDLRNQKVISDINVGEIWSLKIKNNLLYVASGENGVKVLDISDIKNPKQTAIIDTPGRARSVDVSMDGKYIYIADDRDDLQIIKKD